MFMNTGMKAIFCSSIVHNFPKTTRFLQHRLRGERDYIVFGSSGCFFMYSSFKCQHVKVQVLCQVVNVYKTKYIHYLEVESRITRAAYTLDYELFKKKSRNDYFQMCDFVLRKIYRLKSI